MTTSKESFPEIFRIDQALALGVSKRHLYALRDSGEFVSIGRGLFARSDQPDGVLQLAGISLRRPEVTICLTSALVRHGLADDIPSAIDLALPRGMRRQQDFLVCPGTHSTESLLK
ncbi:MAG: type IV toxin-antitoxin system AbiEi family antitoxin domain-containing protein [Thermomicrobiales bacterium]